MERMPFSFCAKRHAKFPRTSLHQVCNLCLSPNHEEVACEACRYFRTKKTIRDRRTRRMEISRQAVDYMWDCFGSEDPETEVGRIVHLSQMRAASLRIRAPDPTWDRTFLHGNLRVLCPLHLLPDHSRCRQVVDCTHSSRQRMLLVHHCFRAMIGTVGCCWKDSPNSKSAIRGHPHRSQADRWCRTLRSWNTIRH